MSKRIKQEQVVSLLVGMGLLQSFAEQAAADERITWTDAALRACLHDLETSKTTSPPKALWSTYLKHGKLPPLPSAAGPAQGGAAVSGTCEVCHDRLSVCHGVHGFIKRVSCLLCGSPLAFCAGHTMEEWRAYDAPAAETEGAA